MNPEQFCYWLMGRAELVPTAPSDAEWECIVEHLRAVFKKETVSAPGFPAPVIKPVPMPDFASPRLLDRVFTAHDQYSLTC